MKHSILDEFEGDELARQLLSLRRQPGAGLEQRIRAIPRQTARPRLAPRRVWASVALAVIAGLLFVSPVAQATLGQFQQVIGQIHLTILDVLPQRADPLVIESTPVSLAEARAAAPFAFVTPSHLPAGLSSQAEVYVLKLESPIVKLLWRDQAGGFVQLSVHQANGAAAQIENVIGAESSDTILINGQEAVIIYGGWDQTSRTWQHQERLVTLIWVIDGVQYNLLSYSTLISSTDLLAMAQSSR
ncbi:MAG: hypothetical protein AB1801_12740 [Chloroflexota bacterium]